MKAPLCFPSCLAFIVPFCDGISRSFAVYAFVLFWHLCVIVRGSAYNSNSWTNGELMPCTYLTTDLRKFYLVLDDGGRWETENER